MLLQMLIIFLHHTHSAYVVFFNHVEAHFTGTRVCWRRSLYEPLVVVREENTTTANRFSILVTSLGQATFLFAGSSHGQAMTEYGIPVQIGIMAMVQQDHGSAAPCCLYHFLHGAIILALE
jgi:hypothetical protein